LKGWNELKSSLISRLKKCERKLNPAQKSYCLVDWNGDGSADKKEKQILKDDPSADVLMIRVKWAE